MEKTADIFIDQGRQAVRLPEGMHLAGERVTVHQDQHTGDVVLSLIPKAPAWRSHEELFRLLDELGPAPPEFMEGVDDPILESETIF